MLKLGRLQGFDSLWHIATLSADEEVRTESRNFLVDLYLKTKEPEKQRKEVSDSFLAKLDIVFAQLQEAETIQNERWPQYWLMLVSAYIRRFDLEHI